MAYTSQQYSEAMDIKTTVSYIPYAKYSKEKTGDIITFAKFEEGGLLSESRNNTESGNEYDEDSTITPLISEAYMDAISSANYYDAEPMSMDLLEDICDIIQSRLSINRR